MNPYETLGISPSATDNEIKQAYRKLAKKYHPDINPDKKLAEEKMKEINFAYDEIKRLRAGGVKFDNTYNSSNTYTDQNFSNVYSQIQALIMNRQFLSAKALLDQIENVDDTWYYFSAIVSFNLGNFDLAMDQINTAISLNPTNPNYQNIKNQMDAFSQMRDGFNTTNIRRVVIRPFSFMRLFFKIIGFFILIDLITLLIRLIFR